MPQPDEWTQANVVAHNQAMQDEWVYIKEQDLFYHGEWASTGDQNMPFAPHGKGWAMAKHSNIGITAAWTNFGTPIGTSITVNQEAQRCWTP